MNRIKPILIALILGVVAYYAYTHFFGHSGGNPEMGGAAPVSVATGVEKATSEWTEFPGRLEAVNTAEIKPRVSGTIEKIHFKDGQMVKRGDLLFTLDTRPYAADVARAKGNLAAANATYVNTKIDFDRAAPLVETGNITKREFDSRKSALYSAEGRVIAAKGDLALAQVNMDYAEVRAPFAGKMGRAEITEGNVVNAGLQAPTLTWIVALSPIYASFEIDEQNFLSHVQKVPADKVTSIPAEIGLANQNNTPYKGHVQAFDNQLNVGSGTIRVRAIFENANGELVPGLFARVRMGSVGSEPTLLINEKAIGTDQSKKFVFAVTADNKAEYREVTTGQTVDGLVVIKTGLKAGDKIIVNGLMRVRPGAPIMPEMVNMTTLEAVK